MINYDEVIASYDQITPQTDSSPYLISLPDTKKKGDQRQPNHIWQVVISVQPTKMREAASAICDLLRVDSAPRLSIQFAGKTKEELYPFGTEVVLSFYDEVQPGEMKSFLSAIQNALIAKGIAPDDRDFESSFAPLCITEGIVGYLFYRDKRVQVLSDQNFDTLASGDKPCFLNGSKLFVKESFYRQLPPAQKHNPQGLSDPFRAICIVKGSDADLSALLPSTRKLPAKLNASVNNVLKNIGALNAHGAIVKKTDPIEGQLIEDCAISLGRQMNERFGKTIPTNAEWINFKQNFMVELHRLEPEMQKHQEIWKPIFVNIVIALTGLGALLLLINAAYAVTTKKGLTFSSGLFLAKPEGMQKMDCIDEALQQISIPPEL